MSFCCSITQPATMFWHTQRDLVGYVPAGLGGVLPSACDREKELAHTRATAPYMALAVLPDTRVLPQLVTALTELTAAASEFCAWEAIGRLPAYAFQVEQEQLVGVWMIITSFITCVPACLIHDVQV